MRVNSFSLMIPEGCERDSGHVELRHNSQYTLRLGNHDSNRNCDAVVSVDGKEVGCFRLHAGCTITLERPAHDFGKFTFFQADSQQAQDAGAGSIGADSRGLIQVVYRPERKRQVNTRTGTRSCEEKTSGGIKPMLDFGGAVPVLSNVSPGITGLTGQSNQQFVNVSGLDYEPNAEVTISLRLVCGTGVRELTPSAMRGNTVPAPV